MLGSDIVELLLGHETLGLEVGDGLHVHLAQGHGLGPGTLTVGEQDFGGQVGVQLAEQFLRDGVVDGRFVDQLLVDEGAETVFLLDELLQRHLRVLVVLQCLYNNTAGTKCQPCDEG